jgi:ABC-type branched-subunit amino acid transport system ATPase component
MDVADRFLIIEKGEIVHEGAKGEVNPETIHGYLTI